MSLDPSATSGPRRRTRVRCQGVEASVSKDSRCTVRVDIEWEGTVSRGESEGTDTPEGRLTAAGQAALNALEGVHGDQIRLEVRGIKLVRAFDSLVVIASLRGEAGDSRYDLMGCTVAQEDIVKGAVLAVLDATNRVFEPISSPIPADSGGTPSSS